MKFQYIIKICGVLFCLWFSPLALAEENPSIITAGIYTPNESHDWENILNLAHQGHSGAQNNVGMAYVWGKNLPQDTAQGLAWLDKSAAQGNDMAWTNLGGIYLYGMGGIAPDYAKAKMFLEQAVQKGNLFAHNHLGLMYFNGLGMKTDYAKAKSLWEYTAEQGDEVAQKMLASMP